MGAPLGSLRRWWRSGNASVHAKLIGMAAVWGASWPAGRSLAHDMPPVTAAMSRFVVTSTVLFAWMLFLRGFPRLSRQQWVEIVLAALTGVLIYAICFMMGLERVEAGRASLVITLTPAMTMLFAIPFYKERVDGWKVIGMVAATIGAIIVLSHGQPARFLTAGVGLGETLLLGCVVSWAIYSLIIKSVLTRLDPMTATAMTSLVGTAMLVVASLVIDGPRALPDAHWSMTTLGVILFLSVGATVVGYAWYFDGIAKLGAGEAAGYITLVPVFGVASSAWLMGETVDLSLVAGGGLALAGLAMMTIDWGKRSGR